MDKCGVADDCHSLALVFAAHSLVEAVKSADGSTHTDCGIHSFKRYGGAECIAADIAAYEHAELLERIENASVRAACAHYRRTYRDNVVKLDELVLFAEYLFAQI